MFERLFTVTRHKPFCDIHSFIHSFIHQYSTLRPVRQEPELSQATGMALAHCILGKLLGVGCHYFPLPLDVPTFVARCLQVHNDARDLSSGRWNRGREMSGNFAEMTIYTLFRDLLYAANLRYGTNGFTSPPKEGALKICPCKIR